jgi:pimeloyl-ACP methyl ester carboxylesterase
MIERSLLAAPSEAHERVEIYSGVARLARTVWGSELRDHALPRDTAVVFCHPTANFLGHYALPGMAARGFGAVGLTTRYVGNDTSLIMENCLLDIGAMVRHLRSLGYRSIVLVGNSGGASIVPYYQAQAQHPTVTDPPGGGPDLTRAGLVPADGLVMFMAHPSRARLSTEWLDPAIVDERQPFERDPGLDMYDARNGPPYAAAFITRYREAQLARNRRISRWAEQQLRTLGTESGVPEGLQDLPFIVHGTTADLRLLDGAIDPSDRPVGVSLWGPPAVANYLPAGIGRVSTLRSWLNQWSIDHTNADSLRWLPEAEVPVLVEFGTADTSVPPHLGQEMYDAVAKAPRELVAIPAAGHYYEGQPALLERALDAMAAWIRDQVTDAATTTPTAPSGLP